MILWPCKVLCVASCRTNKLSVQLQSLKRRTQHRIYISFSRSASIYKCKHVRSLIQLFIICSACILFSLSTVWYFCRRSSCLVQTSPLRSIKCFWFWSRLFPDKLHFHSDILSATWAWNLPKNWRPTGDPVALLCVLSSGIIVGRVSIFASGDKTWLYSFIQSRMEIFTLSSRTKYLESDV